MATNGTLVSLKTIVERVYQDFRFNYALDWNDALEWSGSLLALLNVPYTLQDSVEKIEIKEGRGKLPCNLQSVIQVARAVPVKAASNDLAVVVTQGQGTYFVENCGVDLVNQELKTDCPCSGSDGCEYTLYPMRWATNTFHTKYHQNSWDFSKTNEGASTYTLNSNYIFTNFQEGTVLMACKVIPVDEEGYPLIPGDEWWRNAVKWEIAYRIAFILWTQDSLKDKVFQIIERDRDWYVAQAVNRTKIPSIDEMESWKNEWLRSIPKVNHHKNFFANMQVPEQRYIHPLQFNY